jgi:hypothetical protein
MLPAARPLAARLAFCAVANAAAGATVAGATVAGATIALVVVTFCLPIVLVLMLRGIIAANQVGHFLRVFVKQNKVRQDAAGCDLVILLRNFIAQLYCAGPGPGLRSRLNKSPSPIFDEMGSSADPQSSSSFGVLINRRTDEERR